MIQVSFVVFIQVFIILVKIMTAKAKAKIPNKAT